MILHILNAELAGPASLFVDFSDGCDATVDLRPLLSGPVFYFQLSPVYSLWHGCHRHEWTRMEHESM